MPIAHWSDVAPPPAAARCSRVWTAGPGATFTSCDNGFFRRRGDDVEAAGGRRLDAGDAQIMGDDVIPAVTTTGG